MTSLFEKLFNKSEIKNLINSELNSYLEQHPEYKFYNIEIGLYYGLYNYAHIKANLKDSEGGSLGNLNHINSKFAENLDLLNELKKFIKENKIDSLSEYQVLATHRAQLDVPKI